MKSPGDEEVIVQLPGRQLDDARSNGNCGGANRQRRRHDEIDLTDEGAYDSPACAGYQHLIRRLPKAPERRSERSWRPALLCAKARAVNHNGGARWRRRRTRKASHSRPHLRIEAREEVCRARPHGYVRIKGRTVRDAARRRDKPRRVLAGKMRSGEREAGRRPVAGWLSARRLPNHEESGADA